MVDLAGRGRTGKSTVGRILTMLALDEGREPLIADANENDTLASLYPWASKPPSDDVADQIVWFTDLLGEAVSTDRSLIADLGPAAEVVRRQHGVEFDLPGYCEFRGLDFLTVFTAGPSREDLDYVVGMVESGIHISDPALLFFNEALVSGRKNAAQAFAGVLDAEELRPGGVLREAGVRPMLLPNLPFLDLLREKKLGLRAAMAADGPLDPARQFQVMKAEADLRARFAKLGVGDRLP